MLIKKEIVLVTVLTFFLASCSTINASSNSTARESTSNYESSKLAPKSDETISNFATIIFFLFAVPQLVKYGEEI